MRNYSYSVLFFIPFMLFLVLAFAQSSFAADPNDYRQPNTWQRERTINDSVNKSSVKVEAQKTYPVSTLDQNGKPIKQIRNAKATIKLGASTANVGKSLMKRTPYGAITQAVIAILGKSVDWVLDPDNNRVKYKDGNGDFVDDAGNPDPKRWYIDPDKGERSPKMRASTACRSFGEMQKRYTWKSFTFTFKAATDTCIFNVVYKDSRYPDSVSEKKLDRHPDNWLPSDGQSGGDEYKYIPIDTVAQQVIDNADAGHAPSMEVMNDTALDMLEAGLLDAQLDAASNVPQPDPQEITQAQYDNPDYPENGTGSGTGPETPVDPETPTDPTDPTNPEAKPFELPPFCSWASKVCDFIDWVKTEPPEPPESGEVDVQIPDSNMHEGILERLYINMPAQCPPDPILEFMGAKIPFPMSVFCQFAEMMKPLILLFAYIKGLSIIGNGLN